MILSRKLTRRLLAAGFMATVAGSAAAADGVARLRQFVDSTRAAEGEFEQTVIGASGRRPQNAAGSFAFSRPGKFRWSYDKPYPQLLVSDGKRLWSWDRDLNQVTVKRLGDALGATPAAILAGGEALERNFELTPGGEEDGLTWVDARPKQADSGFQTMRLGFAGDALKRMEMRDNFGQVTVIRFIRLVANPTLDPALFRFAPPPGADVIGDAG